MATRIENSRSTKRPQATATRNTVTGAFTAVTGKFPRLDGKGFPATGGADITRVAITDFTPV